LLLDRHDLQPTSVAVFEEQPVERGGERPW